jgi:uncharacterized protein (TIGR00369 family)
VNKAEHYKRLNKMFCANPINQAYSTELKLSEGTAEVELVIKPEYFHAAGSLHGAIYFKVLDEAASFSAYTLEPEFFMVTSSFTTYITKPVIGGILRGVGKVLSSTRSQCLAEAVLYNSEGLEVARGTGIFVKTKLPFSSALGYSK